MASLKGAWPRTPLPYAAYRDRDHVPFNEWWEKQEFHIVFKNINFSRKELTLTLANQDGGSHLAEKIEEKLAILKYSPSPWKTIGDNESEIKSFELASMCAIGEELLFSLTDEPINRRRMHHEDFQRPFYLSVEESDEVKRKASALLSKIEVASREADASSSSEVHVAQTVLRNIIAKGHLNGEDALALRRGEFALKSLSKTSGN